MTRFGTTEPDTDPALQRAIIDARAERPRRMLGRELFIGTIVAAAFLIAAGAFAVLGDPVRDLDPALAVVLVAAYALACRVEFHMGSVWTDATQLVFVPMLFLLPIDLVPLLVAAALLLARAPEYLSGAVHPQRMVLRIADSWPAIGPALVLSLAGAGAPVAADIPIYIAAFFAQFASDVIPQTIRERFGLGIPVRRVLRDSVAVYFVDSLLAPVGLLAAFAASNETATVVLILPLMALIQMFGREREARIENALTLSSAYRGTAHLLGELLSTTHEYTGHHSRSVVVLAHQVGERLGLDEATLRDVEFGALLHDVGKMAVPNEIINKPGKLTAQEWELMKTHTVEGYEMLERIGGALAEVGAVVRSHHERFDGRGYPDGLAGEQIPIASRVITVCDSFNAMTTERSYSRAMTIPEAIAEMRRETGKQFDPKVVDVVIEIVESWDERPPMPPAAANGAQAQALQPA